jgi:hypothetical protein
MHIGRPNTPVLPGGVISFFIEKFIPGGHTFETNHDRFVGLVQELHLPRIIENVAFNYPSMAVMYPLAVVQEIINTPTGLFNTVFGSNFNVPLPHKDPVK